MNPIIDTNLLRHHRSAYEPDSSPDACAPPKSRTKSMRFAVILIACGLGLSFASAA
ncbi:MAG: hypothetical protein ACU0BB_06680 [Paracoccaceae bacterium]